MRRKPGKSHCPINFTLELLGDSWSLLIVRDLMFFKKRRYKEFLGSAEGIATNILADRLLQLEHHGIVRKTNDIYSLTNKGADLLPVLVEMIAWGSKYDPKTATPKELIGLLQESPAVFRKKIRTMASGKHTP